jgi:hypothetical protein
MDREDGDQLVIELPGGGSLGYAVFGNPDGVPCFAFHGNSSSRLMPGWMFPPERVPDQPHVIWRRIGTHAIFTPPPGP